MGLGKGPACWYNSERMNLFSDKTLWTLTPKFPGSVLSHAFVDIEWAFPSGSAVKNLPAMQEMRVWWVWVRKIPWRRKWLPTPVFLPGKSHGQRRLVGYSDGVANSMRRLSMYTYTECNHSLPDNGLSVCLSPHLDSEFLEGREGVLFSLYS